MIDTPGTGISTNAFQSTLNGTALGNSSGGVVGYLPVTA